MGGPRTTAEDAGHRRVSAVHDGRCARGPEAQRVLPGELGARRIRLGLLEGHGHRERWTRSEPLEAPGQGGDEGVPRPVYRGASASGAGGDPRGGSGDGLRLATPPEAGESGPFPAWG